METGLPDSGSTGALADPVTEVNEAPSFAAEVVPGERVGPSKPLPKILYLKYGFIRYSASPASKTSKRSADAEKDKGGPAFAFFSRRVIGKSIQLFANQAVKLVEELPAAFQAFRDSDSSYRYVLCENKTNLVTLEVSPWNGKNYLFLKRYFRATADNETVWSSSVHEINHKGWLPTKSVVSFDPAEDEPIEILDFVLSCLQ